MSENEPPQNDQPSSGVSTEQKEEKLSLKQGVDVIDKTAKAVDSVGGVFGAIKWASISLILLIVVFLGYSAFKLLTKPVAMVGDVMGSAGSAVSSGADIVKDSAAQVVGRLNIPAPDQKQLDKLAEKAFMVLNAMPVQDPKTIRERLYWKANFGDSGYKICEMTFDFGNGDLDVLAGADNETYETAKSLGSLEDRTLRLILRTDNDDVPFIVTWDQEANWQMKWKATTMKKPVGDDVAAARILDILKQIPKQCQ